jgi:hypothetical protein
MTGEPVSTALVVTLAASGVSTGAGLLASREQERVDLAFLEAETERAKLEATDEAIVRAKGFREALASQLAISSLRSGSGGSLVRQFGAVSVSNFLKDQDVLSRRKEFIDIASQSNRAQIRANRFGRDISSIGSLLSSGVQSINLNKLTTPGGTK